MGKGRYIYTNPPIFLTGHAEDARRERIIRDDQIIITILYPDKILPGYKGAFRYRKYVSPPHQGNYLQAVVVKEQGEIRVITCYWKDTPMSSMVPPEYNSITADTNTAQSQPSQNWLEKAVTWLADQFGL